MANPEHLALLMDSVEAWNAWRQQNPDVRPDLRDANLRWCDLAGADLHGADLDHAILCHANLTGANLVHAWCWSANLGYTNLSNADLTRSIFETAHFENAILIDARMDDAQLQRAFLKDVRLTYRNARLRLENGRFAGIDFNPNSPRNEVPDDSVREPDPEHLAMLRKGAAAWNTWRAQNRKVRPDLRGADLSGSATHKADLRGVDLRGADLRHANLFKADLSEAQLDDANLSHAHMSWAELEGASLQGANLSEAEGDEVLFKDARLFAANLRKAEFREARIFTADLRKANVSRASLSRGRLMGANFSGANLAGADLSHADLTGSTLSGASLRSANLSGANLSSANMVEVDFTEADLSGCAVYGISAWNLELKGVRQSNLLISGPLEAPVRVDDLEMAQFIHLLMSREKLRNVITTMGEKAVLILGRFTERKELLDRMAEKLRELGYLPMIFDFERPTDRDLTETVKVLAGLSRFVIADITNPRSVPLELQATVPDYMVPFVTIVEKGQPVFGMFDDLPRKHHWALPLLEYSSADRLIEAFGDVVVNPALEKGDELRLARAAPSGRRSI
jgi:uncharacterized protein YjbI with pentapeptide repeats